MEYKEKFKEAKRLYETANADQKYVLESLFPELTESEDEKIRKALKEYFINSFQNNGVAAICGVHIKDILAWLEKQGEEIIPLKETILNVWEIGNYWKELTKGVCNTEYGTQLDYTIKHWKEGEHYIKSFNKQGEQKLNPVLDIEIPFGAKDSELQEASYYIPEGFHAEIEGNRVVIKRGEQKPAYTKEYDFHGIKFAKGDIIKDKKCGEVSTIKDFSYDTGLYTHTYGQFPITIQNNYEIIEQKSWSEEDEKMLNDTIQFIETGWTDNGKSHLIPWLKSLKERVQRTASEHLEAE